MDVLYWVIIFIMFSVIFVYFYFPKEEIRKEGIKMPSFFGQPVNTSEKPPSPPENKTSIFVPQTKETGEVPPSPPS